MYVRLLASSVYKISVYFSSHSLAHELKEGITPRDFVILSPSGTSARFMRVNFSRHFLRQTANEAVIEVPAEKAAKPVVWILGLDIFRHFHCNSFQFGLFYSDLMKLAHRLPREIRSLEMTVSANIKTKPLLKALRLLPNLKSLKLFTSCGEIDRELFFDERFLRLKKFEISKGIYRDLPDKLIHFDDELFKQQKWRWLSSAFKTNVTRKGLHEVICQWTEGEREIESYALLLPFKHNAATELRIAGHAIPRYGALKLTFNRPMDSTKLTVLAKFFIDELFVSLTCHLVL